MLDRKKDSHKGNNGKVMVVGGSPMFHGAPILCALGAEVTGVDLVFPFIPAPQAEAAKSYSLNFIIQTFAEEALSPKDVKSILNFSEKVDVLVLGPGLGTDPKTKRAIKSLLSSLQVPTVVDASALLYTNNLPETTVLTPHRGEFEALFGDEATAKNVQKWSKDLGATIVCKGPEDVIVDGDELALNKTGNALMTVGGTGDVLSGLIGGFMAQGLSPFEAGKTATQVLGQAGDELAEVQGSLRAFDLIQNIPPLL